MIKRSTVNPEVVLILLWVYGSACHIAVGICFSGGHQSGLYIEDISLASSSLLDAITKLGVTCVDSSFDIRPPDAATSQPRKELPGNSQDNGTTQLAEDSTLDQASLDSSALLGVLARLADRSADNSFTVPSSTSVIPAI